MTPELEHHDAMQRERIRAAEADPGTGGPPRPGKKTRRDQPLHKPMDLAHVDQEAYPSRDSRKSEGEIADILIVDDEKTLRDLLLRVLTLKFSDLSVLAAEDGLAAVEILRRCRPRVVVLDINMPRMNGYDLCSHIRDNHGDGAIDIIAMTGWQENPGEREILDLGARLCLPKPFGLDRLIEEVQTGLRNAGRIHA